LEWASSPKNVLILGKFFDSDAREYMDEIAIWLRDEKQMNVLVPDEMAKESGFKGHSEEEDFQSKIDFIVAVGGDGTLLYVNSLFPDRVPPVIPFRVGSLAFMAIFDVSNYKAVIEYVMEGMFTTLSRNRLEFCVQRNGTNSPEPGSTHIVLNEAVVNNGPTGSVCTLDTYCNGHMITTVTGDGLIVGTSTGSTAYNLAAGGTMVHPNVAGILFTPICPHSLSFRPVILPPSVTLRVTVPHDARNSSWALFDGRHNTELAKGDSLIAKMAKFPLPTVCDPNETNEWFHALAQCLHWNVRERQKAFPAEKSKI